MRDPQNNKAESAKFRMLVSDWLRGPNSEFYRGLEPTFPKNDNQIMPPQRNWTDSDIR